MTATYNGKIAAIHNIGQGKLVETEDGELFLVDENDVEVLEWDGQTAHVPSLTTEEASSDAFTSPQGSDNQILGDFENVFEIDVTGEIDEEFVFPTKNETVQYIVWVRQLKSDESDALNIRAFNDGTVDNSIDYTVINEELTARTERNQETMPFVSFESVDQRYGGMWLMQVAPRLSLSLISGSERRRQGHFEHLWWAVSNDDVDRIRFETDGTGWDENDQLIQVFRRVL